MSAFVALRMFTLPPGRESEAGPIAERLNLTAGALAGVRSSWAGPVVPNVAINAGHLVWRMMFATEGAALAVASDPCWTADIAPMLEGLQALSIGYRLVRCNVRPAGRGIWRALIFRVGPHAPAASVQALEASTLLMPRYISAIRSWGLSTVAQVDGAKAYTHVWEQEFDDLHGLTGDYMSHPIHWGLVDAFFDADCPKYIVDPQLIQVVGEIDRTIMA